MQKLLHGNPLTIRRIALGDGSFSRLSCLD